MTFNDKNIASVFLELIASGLKDNTDCKSILIGASDTDITIKYCKENWHVL